MPVPRCAVVPIRRPSRATWVLLGHRSGAVVATPGRRSGVARALPFGVAFCGIARGLPSGVAPMLPGSQWEVGAFAGYAERRRLRRLRHGPEVVAGAEGGLLGPSARGLARGGDGATAASPRRAAWPRCRQRRGTPLIASSRRAVASRILASPRPVSSSISSPPRASPRRRRPASRLASPLRPRLLVAS